MKKIFIFALAFLAGFFRLFKRSSLKRRHQLL